MTIEWTCLEDGARAALNGQQRLAIRGGEEDDESLGDVGIVSSVTVKGARQRWMNVCFAPCKGIQESLGFWIPRPWISDSRFCNPVLVSGSCVLNFNR